MRTRRRALAIALWSMAFLAATIAPAAAQTRAVRAGTAFDQTGAVLPGVSVTLTSPNLIADRRLPSAAWRGRYRFADLLPGLNDLTFQLGGFQTLTQSAIRVAFLHAGTGPGVSG